MITVYNFARGARGLRVLWQCEEMSLPYKVIPVSFPPSESYRARNPLGTVPFVEDEGGVAIHESVAIMLYFAQKYGPTPLLPAKDDPALARVLQMTVFGEASLGMNMNPLLAAHFSAPEADKRNWSVLAQEARVELAVRAAADVLGSGPFLAGAALTLADISVGCALGMWRTALGKTLREPLARYHERLTARPAYQRGLAATQ